MLLVLTACATLSDLHALEARVDAAEAAHQEDEARIAALEERMRAQDELLASFASPGASEPAPEAAAQDAPCADGVGYPDTSLRVMPHRDAAGTPDGFRLSAIRRGSRLACAGLKNGDVVTKIGGLPAATEAALRAALEADPSSWNLDLTRRGTAIHLPPAP